jgi:hypothetical protein
VLVLFPTSPGRFRVIADIGRSEGAKSADPTSDKVQAIEDRRAPGQPRVSNPIWPSAFRINERKVRDYRQVARA